MKYSVLLLTLCFISAYSHGQVSRQKYYPPKDTLVIHKLQHWSNDKFGLLMHWGTYSQWGIVESWSLCPEDEGWCQRQGPYAATYFEYKQQYENLQTTFNPTHFNPDKWAAAAAKAGMRYVVFTTKHHDGFCMFDTKQTDYKITSTKCPYSKNPQPDVTRAVFDAFRKQHLGIGAYFSKPDWHCPNYWDPYFPPLDRNPNYSIKKYPEKWKQYKQFTFNQIKELMTGYGHIDILWLDGGWVRPDSLDEDKDARIKNNQDVDMNAIASMARTYQPGLIVVDRDVPGVNQNYLTPEQQLPDTLLPYPWETCMTMGNSWSWVKDEHYKSAEKLIQTLAKIVSRGGNFLLNIAPNADGEWDSTAYVRLKEIGAWMDINGSAIYNTHPVKPYQKNDFVFTQNGNIIYAIYIKPKDSNTLPADIDLSVFTQTITNVTILGNPSVKATVAHNKAHIAHADKLLPSEAWVLKLGTR